MTTPTQAQIEAAAKAIYDLPVNWRANKPSWEKARYQYINEAKAALTAAAQVGRRKVTHSLRRTSPKGGPFVGVCVLCGTENLSMDAAKLECENWRGLSQEDAVIEAAAAAQVGEPDTNMRLRTENLRLKFDKAATIERCAQRLEQFYLNSEGKIRDADALDDYIAAIRKLKDET